MEGLGGTLKQQGPVALSSDSVIKISFYKFGQKLVRLFYSHK